MHLAYFDCFHGAAGDMLLASLLDAGLEQTALHAVLERLPLRGYRLEHRRTVRHGVSGSQVRITVDEPQPPRSWAAIRALLQQSDLPPATRQHALGTFARLARAESAIHNTPLEAVHFHEIGAVDSIVDIVGVCAGIDLLGIQRVAASPLPLGAGWVATQHGPLPVPAPATLAVLAEVAAPTLAHSGDLNDPPGELVTPTGAALLAELAHFARPAMRLQRVDYGFGQRQMQRLNGLRVWLGTDAAAAATEALPADVAHEQVIELRCNLDDSSGELVAYTIEHLMGAGALDAWAVPLVMKKGRPAVQLACLVRPADVERLALHILHETSTFGVRWQPMQRYAAARQTVTVPTPWGTVRVKQKILGGVVVARAPEYEDCAALARAQGVPLAQVYAAALGAG